MEHISEYNNWAVVILLLSFPKQNRLCPETTVHLQKLEQFDSCTTVREQQTPWCKSSLPGRSTYSEKQESAVMGAEELSYSPPTTFIDQQAQKGPSPQEGASAV